MQITTHGTVTVSKKDGQDHVLISGFEVKFEEPSEESRIPLMKLKEFALLWALKVLLNETLKEA